MSATVQRVNLEPVTTVLDIWRKDLPLADKALAQPLNALALVDGEWLTINNAYQWVRAANVSSAGTAATVRSFPLFFERGRSDRLGMSERKSTCLFRGEWEADTRIFDATATVGSGAPITAVMQPLKVASITLGSRVYCGLVGHGGSADTNPVVAYVTRLPASNGGKLRIMSGYRS